MLDRIIVSSDHKTATLIYDNRAPVTLYQEEGKVVRMLDEFLAPITTNCETLTAYVNSFEDTVSINVLEAA